MSDTTTGGDSLTSEPGNGGDDTAFGGFDGWDASDHKDAPFGVDEYGNEYDATGAIIPELVNGESDGLDQPVTDAEVIGYDLERAPGMGWEFANDRSTGKEVERWKVTDDPSDWGFGGEKKPGSGQHDGANDGARPGGGTSFKPPKTGAGNPGAGTSKTKSRNPLRRRRSGGGAGGGGTTEINLFRFGGGHKTNNLSLIDTRGTKAGVIETKGNGGIILPSGRPGSSRKRPTQKGWF